MLPSDALDHIMTASHPSSSDWDDFDKSIRETTQSVIREIRKVGQPSQGFAEALLEAYGKLCQAGEHETAGRIRYHLLDMMAGTPVTLSAELGRILRAPEPVELENFLAPPHTTTTTAAPPETARMPRAAYPTPTMTVS